MLIKRTPHTILKADLVALAIQFRHESRLAATTPRDLGDEGGYRYDEGLANGWLYAAEKLEALLATEEHRGQARRLRELLG